MYLDVSITLNYILVMNLVKYFSLTNDVMNPENRGKMYSCFVILLSYICSEGALTRRFL